MVFKLFILIFFLGIKIGYTNIIYDKNDFVITEIEMNNYKNLYKNNLGTNISNNKAIKNIILIKKTISFLTKNNPDLLSSLDQNIKLQYSKEIFDDQDMLNFIRFQMIRNDFTLDYYNKIFNIEDLEIIFANFDNLKLPVSKNDCLTVEKLHEVNNDKNFIESFFKNIKNKNQKIITLINNELYEVCLNNKLFKDIESEIIKFIENKTKNDFDKFIYKKIN